jgi:hypothetical protein
MIIYNYDLHIGISRGTVEFYTHTYIWWERRRFSGYTDVVCSSSSGSYTGFLDSAKSLITTLMWSVVRVPGSYAGFLDSVKKHE